MSQPAKKILSGIAATAIVLGLGAGILHVRHGVKVRIHNAGSEPLHGVVVHVTGNSYPLGDIAAGAVVSTRVEAKGESHVEIEFRSVKGAPKRLIVDCYFEGGPYRGTVSVDLDSEKILKVSDSISIGF